MNYKIYISGYIEETQQLLVSFSSDKTERDAKDYPSFSFDVVSYGDISVEEILLNIAKTAPVMAEEIVTQESFANNDEKSNALRNLVGQSFNYAEEDLFPNPQKEVEEI